MSQGNVSNSADDRLLRRRPRTPDTNSVAPGWYYELMGRAVGPLTSAQLLKKIRAGEITETTRLRKDDSQWVDASTVDGLFEAAQRDSTYYKCPYCGSRVDKPPTVCLACDREVTAVYRVREHAPEPLPAETNADPANDAGHEPVKANGTVVHLVITWLRSLVR